MAIPGSLVSTPFIISYGMQDGVELLRTIHYGMYAETLEIMVQSAESLRLRQRLAR